MKKVLLLLFVTMMAVSLMAEDFNIILVDSFGDGWNGGMADVSVNGVVVLDDITVPDDGGWGNGGIPYPFTFAVSEGDAVVVTYTAGEYSGENSYTITNNIDVVIYTSSAPPVDSYAFTATIGSTDAGVIAGTVTDGTDPIEGAVVTAGMYTATTASDGTYQITDAFVGNYNVVCSAANFFSATENVDVTVGETTTVDFALEALFGNDIATAIDVVLVDGVFTHAGTNEVYDNTYTYGGGNDLVFHLMLDGAAMVDASLLASDYDTKLAIYADTETDLTSDNALYSNDDYTAPGRNVSIEDKIINRDRALQSAIYDMDLAAGGYWILVDAYSATNIGNYQLDLAVEGTGTETMIYQVRLYDVYGDGWDVAYGGPNLLDVTVDGTVVLDDIFLADGYGPEAYSFDVMDGSVVTIDFTTVGQYPGENSYDVVDDAGTVIFTSASPPEASYSFEIGAFEIPSVFFSEYIEGSSNNKALEIANMSDADVALTNFFLLGNYNGNAWSEAYPLSDVTIAAGDVYVLASVDASAPILDVADVTFAYGDPWYVTAFNGDDVRALAYVADEDTTIVDIIGAYDMVDPGAGWDVAGTIEGTQNHTLVRKEAVVMGNTDWAVSAGTDAYDSEWIVYDEDTFTYLGGHNQTGMITGLVTIDGFGDLSMASISVGVLFSTYADETGAYTLEVPPGSYEVTASLSGYDDVILAGVECIDEQTTENVDFALTVIPETLWPPVNLNAAIEGSNVNVAWTAPTQYGWNGYYDGPQSLTWVAGERAVLYDVTDFGFSYPMEISQLSHGFYHHSSYPWGDDNTFTFKIYDADGATVIYESEVLTALEQWDDTILELAAPITVTDNFWVAVVTTNQETGFPSSLFDADTMNLHGYVGTAGAWEVYADWATMVYIDGAAGRQALAYNASSKKVENNVTNTRAIKRIDSAIIDGRIPEDSSRDLLSFNLFRDGTQLNTEPLYDVMYTDLAVPAGEHTYYATALWNYGESAASNEATVNLSYGNLSGTVMAGGNPVVGAIISADTYSATTDDAGAYLIENMLVGTYEVTCSAAGFDAVEPQTAEITDGGNTVIDFVLEAGIGTISFLDDFEGGDANWTFDVDSTWGISEEGAHSPTHCLTESPNADYSPSLNVSATLATPWDLSTTLGAELSFWYQSDIETAFDYMYLEISTDGAEWANLATYDEEDGAWQQETISLGGFVGAGYETVSIRFRFESDTGYETVGMLIDDVMLTVFDDDIFAPFIAHTGPEFYEGTADDYVFTATIIDISGIAEANVVYTVDEENEVILPFTSVDGETYTFTIPAQEAGAQVDYAIQAIDLAPTPNTALAEGYVYIAGTPFIYDNGIVDFYTVFAEGTGAAELILNPAGNQLNLAYALIRNYTDQSGQDNDPFEFHVWSSVDGLPGEDLIAPFVVVAEANYADTSPMTRIDLRDYATELNNIQGNFFIGFLVNQGGEFGTVHCTTTSDPAMFSNSYSMIDGIWSLITSPSVTDLHFRAVAELIPVTTGIIAGTVTDVNDGAIAGATITIGTAMGTTDASGAYSITADPGMQDVLVEADSYIVFNGSVDVIPNETVTYDVVLDAILWAPSNLTWNYNDPNLILSWDEPTAPVQGEVLFEGFEVWPPADWTFNDVDADGYEWADGATMELVAHTGTGVAYSASYDNTAGVLTPDNWLISPAVNIGAGATVNYWVAAQDAAWAGEHYAVYVSTTGTEIADFEMVFEETMIARNGTVKNGARGSRVQGTWYERTVDLSSYAGTVYVAFRHFDCTDMFYLNLDDVTIGETASATRSLAGYNIYRDDVQLNTTLLTSLLYVDPAPFDDATYYVTAVYESPDGESVASNSVNVGDLNADEDLVLVTELKGNYPNPFNPTTAINFSLVNPGKVSLKVYNAKGQLVKTLVNGQLGAANYEVVWNGTDSYNKKVTSGIYFYRMMSKDYSSTKKMMLLK